MGRALSWQWWDAAILLALQKPGIFQHAEMLGNGPGATYRTARRAR